jgi:Tfp pilus assembly protein PilX
MNHKSKHMNKQSLVKNQKGLVSFVVVIIIMLLLSLIVLGFARLSRREQRQSLDRQLSTQAFYAAETGVNDAVDALKTLDLDPKVDKNNCDTIPNHDPVINTTGPISYTCVLVDPTPTEYTFDAITQNGSEIVKIQSTSPLINIDTINIYWQDKDGRTGFTNCPEIELDGLPQAWPATCETGMLRVDLIPNRLANDKLFVSCC